MQNIAPAMRDAVREGKYRMKIWKVERLRMMTPLVLTG